MVSLVKTNHLQHVDGRPVIHASPCYPLQGLRGENHTRISIITYIYMDITIEIGPVFARTIKAIIGLYLLFMIGLPFVVSILGKVQVTKIERK